MKVRQYFIVTRVGVVVEQFGCMSDWVAASRAWKQACVLFPAAGCRILMQNIVVAGDGSLPSCGLHDSRLPHPVGVVGGDAALARRNHWRRCFEYIRGRRGW